MMTPADELTLRPAVAADLPRLEAIRAAAFAPIFASFRRVLGDTIYDAAQAPEDQAQPAHLESLLAEGSIWEVYAAELAGVVVGFVSLRLDRAQAVGEIGLNAVDPTRAGAGIGTAMYDFAIQRMRAAGMRVATVATGGDPSHAPARAAYRKVGFDVEFPSVWMCMEL
jgi:GNAT superfamily N-acetyltransferase